MRSGRRTCSSRKVPLKPTASHIGVAGDEQEAVPALEEVGARVVGG